MRALGGQAGHWEVHTAALVLTIYKYEYLVLGQSQLAGGPATGTGSVTVSEPLRTGMHWQLQLQLP